MEMLQSYNNSKWQQEDFKVKQPALSPISVCKIWKDTKYCITKPGLNTKKKYQKSIQSSTTPDPGYQWESHKLTVDTTNESQEVSPFPAGDHKAHINRRKQRHRA